MSVISFPDAAGRESDRLTAIHIERRKLNDLAASAGTPAEWLAAAISHLKAQTSGESRSGGSAVVSVAAIDLVLMRLEALEHGGQHWTGNAA